MSVDDTDLLAYIDGGLTPQRRAEVEAAVADSRMLAERLAAMRASALPYAAAFDRQSSPQIPQNLADHVSDLVRVSTSASTPAASRGRSRTWVGAAAATLAALLICGGALKFGTGAPPSAWIRAVASYQELYVRETLSTVAADAALTQTIVSDSRAAGVPVSIPDLRSNGLEFKRVQRLSFHDQPVIQIVYLPEAGNPVALCITREPQAREAPHFQQLGAMQAAVWHDGALGYVLIARNTHLDLVSLGRRIASGETRILFRSDTGTG